MSYPTRIVCLTEETTETLYLLGEGDRVVGVSGYTVRPPEARQKPKVSAFINARFDKIDALKPDLVLAFSDLQADIARELIRRGYPVYTFNQRSVAEILQMIRILGALVGRADAGEELVEIAGGDPIFPELRDKALGKDRIVDPAVVIERNPDVIIASWCGKAMRKRTIVERPGWDRIAAVRNDRIHEIKSTYILQPGPASLTEG